uniref:Sushi domain-containing protein n=1 Tax=Gadus morhua TaxID=8049 RepID=A0A8C5FTF8_GADMO
MLDIGAVLLLLIGVADGVPCKLPQVNGTTYPDAKRDQFSPRETVSVKCDRGHWFSYDDQQTQKTITCAESGQWDTAAICQGVTCQLPQVTGTTYPDAKRDPFSPGETLSVKCDQGHWFSYDDQQTQKTITCTESGQWDKAAICQAIRCQDPNDPNLKERLESQWLGRHARYQCREGFTPTDAVWATCTKNGWTPNPLCKVIPPCNIPTRVENADITENQPAVYNHGAAVTYACRTNYRMEGEGTIKCQWGNWSPRNPTCIEVTCKLPQLNGNTYLHYPNVNKDRFLPGETVLVKCDRDRCFSYSDQQTQKTITCTGSGEWDTAPKCQVIRCQDPNDPNLKERLESRWMDGDAPYQCREGFTLTNGGWARCTENGWTPNPLCEVARCYLPTTVENADIIEKKQEVYNHGAAVTYACRTNYRMEGERTIRCQSGQWSSGTPTCIVIPPCNLPTTVENADITENQQVVYNHGAAVTYACHKNYRMEGEGTIRCQNGQWSPNTPTCIGVKTFCNATQPNITTQCFGSLGGIVEVLLPKTSQNDTYRLKKDNIVIVNIRSETTDWRYSFIASTGIFTIEDVSIKDAGEYSMEVHDADGKQVANTQFYLTIHESRIPFIARSLTVVLLLLAALGVYWALKKKKTSRPRDIALSSMAVDDDVLYVNVSGATGRAGGE